MNYIVLNDNDFYRDVNLKNFREVFIDGRSRVDGVFGTITRELLEQTNEDSGGGDNFFREQWLLGDSGIVFVVLRFPQDILYDDTGESLERCFGLFNKEGFYVEMGAIKLEDKENTYEYIVVAYNKNLGFKLLFDERFIEKKAEDIVPFVCKKIEEKIL